MLKELKGIKQDGLSNLNKRLFSDEFFDIFVWSDPNNSIERVEICYDKPGKERSITWQKSQGYSHNKIENDEKNFWFKSSPVLFISEDVDYRLLYNNFNERSTSLDSSIRFFITKKIVDFIKNA